MGGKRIEVEEIPVEKKWRRLLNVCMDYYHTWREVVKEEFGYEKANELEIKWGKKLGEKTAEIYRKVGWIKPDDLSSLAKALVISMRILNEDCEALEEDKNKIRIVHYHCPEYDEYEKRGVPGGCMSKCFAWYVATIQGINPQIKVEFSKTFPKDGVCEITMHMKR